MDLNYLLHREQVERMRADEAGCDESRAAHLGLAQGYRTMIDGQRRSRLAAAGLTPDLRAPRP